MNSTEAPVTTPPLPTANQTGTHSTEGVLPTGTAFLATDWTKLQHGDVVWIRRKGDATRAARVDTMTPDGSVLWVRPGGASTRKMHHRSDGEEMWSLRQTADNAPTIDARLLTLPAAKLQRR
jgi:hypothetical protein